jgi:hypothetical protein
VFKTLRERGGHSLRWAAEPEMMILLLLLILIRIISVEVIVFRGQNYPTSSVNKKKAVVM